MQFSRKRAAAVATGAALTLIVGGVAFAYWSTTGSGTGSAATGNVVAVTINATSPAVTGLYPGGPAQNVSGNFNNPNSGSVYIQQVSVAVDPTWSAGSTNPCTAADFTVTAPAANNAEIIKGNGVGAWGTATIKMNNLATNQDSCKGVTVPLVFSSN